MDRLDRDYAARLDRDDPLAAFRSRFHLPPGKIYLDGNSLGLASVDAERALSAAVSAWRESAIEAWTDGDRPWFDLAERLGAQEASLVGALPHEVVVTGGTTINLHALATTFYEGGVIVTDDRNFPSDLYALRSQARLRGGELRVVTTADEPEEALLAALQEAGEDAALLLVSSVDYRTGRLYDLETLAVGARKRGAAFGVDLSHSVGCVPHALHDSLTDFAFWCGYKYLNGGPGAPAGLFVHERTFTKRPALSGWWGSDKRSQFEMRLELIPAYGAGSFQIGTPSVLALAALEGALGILLEAEIERIRTKSLGLTDLLVKLADDRLAPLGFGVATPRTPERRGGHVALTHPHASAIAQVMRRHGVIPDFRPPDIVRLAPVALYTSFVDVWDAIRTIEDLVTAGEHLQRVERTLVT